jgi:hypothetical protein
MITNEKESIHNQLLKNIKAKLPEFEKLLEEINGEWEYCDLIYRYYHGSFKVYYIQNYTIKIVNLLKSVAPERIKDFNEQFEEIFKDGTNIKFSYKHNKNWNKYTLPQLQAFFHAKYFLEMAIKCGKEMKSDESCMRSSYAGLLYFYNMR